VAYLLTSSLDNASMTTDRVDSLDDLATKVDDKFASHREIQYFTKPLS
jgi:hypothetical protein